MLDIELLRQLRRGMENEIFDAVNKALIRFHKESGGLSPLYVDINLVMTQTIGETERSRVVDVTCTVLV